MEHRLSKIQPYQYRDAILFLLLFMLSCTGNADEVIVNTSVKQNTISNKVLQSIFNLKLRTWPDGSPITVYVLSDQNPIHNQFCKRALNVYPHQMRRAWNRRVLSGTGKAPIELASETEMQEKVATTLGAIGYIKKTKSSKHVRTLLTY